MSDRIVIGNGAANGRLHHAPEPPIDGREPNADESHPDERLGRDRLPEERYPEEERADRQQEGDEQEVRGSRNRQDAKIQQIGQGSAEQRDAEEGRPDLQVREWQKPGPIHQERERDENDRAGGDLPRGDLERCRAAEASSVDAGQGVSQGGAETRQSTDTVAPGDPGQSRGADPRKPNRTPTPFGQVSLSLWVSAWAARTVEIGVVAFRMEASPLEMRVSP